MAKLSEAQIAEIQTARDMVASGRTGWVQIKPEWFASHEDFVSYLCERKQKARVQSLDALLAACRAILEDRNEG